MASAECTPPPCEKPLTGKNVVKAIQKELDRDGGYTDANGDHPGMDLNYFGARYYDPVIGYWISLDPKEQFWSGYSYSANGFNPVNSVDSDGNFVANIVGAASGIGLGVVINLATGQDITVAGVLTDGILGAVGAGLASKSKNIGHLAKSAMK